MRRDTEFEIRKARLSERIAAQREQLSERMEAVKPLCALFDRGIGITRAIRAHPGWVAAAMGAIIAARPKRAWRWVRRGFVAWRSTIWLKRTVETVLARALTRQ